MLSKLKKSLKNLSFKEKSLPLCHQTKDGQVAQLDRATAF